MVSSHPSACSTPLHSFSPSPLRSFSPSLLLPFPPILFLTFNFWLCIALHPSTTILCGISVHIISYGHYITALPAYITAVYYSGRRSEVGGYKYLLRMLVFLFPHISYPCFLQQPCVVLLAVGRYRYSRLLCVPTSCLGYLSFSLVSASRALTPLTSYLVLLVHIRLHLHALVVRLCCNSLVPTWLPTIGFCLT